MPCHHASHAHITQDADAEGADTAGYAVDESVTDGAMFTGGGEDGSSSMDQEEGDGIIDLGALLLLLAVRLRFVFNAAVRTRLSGCLFESCREDDQCELI